MADVLVFEVTAGPVVDGDVVSRELSVVVDGVSEGTRNFPPNTTNFGQLEVPQDAAVSLTLVDIDDAGNRSEPAVADFRARDTLPPAAPGSFGVTLLSERAETPAPAPEPEPTPEPDPAPEPAPEVVDPPADSSDSADPVDE